MNNEPVAWTNADCLEMVKEDGESNMWWMPDLAEDIPLYTHPAKTEDEPNWKEMYWEMHELNHKHWPELKAHPAKTLTDEEIIKTMVQFDVYSADDQCLIEAGRTILRKAQEK